MMIQSFGRTIGRIACAAAVIAAACSCQFDDTDLRNSIDDLTGRVEALEDFRDKVQGEINDLQSIIEKLQEQVTVESVVTNPDGSYTINFSDDTDVTISDGQDGKDGEDGQDGKDGLTPPTVIVIMGDDGVYYWGYEDSEGNEDFILDDDGNRIPVTGTAPQVRINPQTGNWEISTDGGIEWTDTGMPSQGTGDSLFEAVDQDEDYVYITLHGGETIVLPKAKELLFDFGTDEEILYFTPGETKTLQYTMSGASDYSIAKPDGWRVMIEGSALIITAPAADNAFAENEGNINIILVAGNGQSLIAKLDVAVKAQQELPAPQIGDFFYSDGTWSSEYDASKTALGIVFQTDPARIGSAETEAGFNHGLVMALKIAGEYIGWSDIKEDIPELENTYLDAFYSDLSGLHNCTTVWNKDNYDASDYKAFGAVAAWNEEGSQYKAPANTSGWFIPSSGQMYDMFRNLAGLGDMDEADNSGHNYFWEGNSYKDFAGKLNAWMDEIPDGQKDLFMADGSSDHLWTSSETYDSNARAWAIYAVGTVECESCQKTWGADMSVRAILAF